MKKILLSAIWMLLAAACVTQEPVETIDPAQTQGVGVSSESAVPSEPAVGEPVKKNPELVRVSKKKKPVRQSDNAAPAKRKEAESRLEQDPGHMETGTPLEPVTEGVSFGDAEASVVDKRPETAQAEPSPYPGKLSAGEGNGYGRWGEDKSESVYGSKSRKDSRFLPMHRRIDRGINQGRFAYKGELILGLTASYGTLTSEETDFLVILDNINLKGTMATVKPFIGYFYRDNRCIGMRFGYQHMSGSLNNLDLDLGDKNDITMNIGGMSLSSDSYSFGLFHRSYVGLDPKGRFGLFAEVEASVTTGTSDFTNGTGNSAKTTYSDNFKAKLSFNPGLAIYIFPNVCTTVSIGLGGLQYSSVTQRDAEGNETGSRKASKMQFRVNIADINFGVAVHLWDKKKK